MHESISHEEDSTITVNSEPCSPTFSNQSTFLFRPLNPIPSQMNEVDSEINVLPNDPPTFGDSNFEFIEVASQ